MCIRDRVAEEPPPQKAQKRCHSTGRRQGKDTPAETASVSRQPTENEVVVFGNKTHFVVRGFVDTPPDYAHDWTSKYTGDTQWRFLTKKQHDMLRELLLQGIPVQFKSNGVSLEPLVMSGETVHLVPRSPDVNCNIRPGDIVFCHVQPNWRYYVHLVWQTYTAETEHGVEKLVYVIGNNKNGPYNKCNGWCYREHIHGILAQTSRGEYDRGDTTEIEKKIIGMELSLIHI